jgi:hypothetical protein
MTSEKFCGSCGEPSWSCKCCGEDKQPLPSKTAPTSTDNSETDDLESRVAPWRRGGDDCNAMDNMLAEISRLRADVERLTRLADAAMAGRVELRKENTRLSAENLALHELVASLESREVCTVAHEDVETCGYCQRDRLFKAVYSAAVNTYSPASPPDDAGEGACAHLYRTSDPNKGACIYCGALNGEG